ncbi:PP2C family protein-serine/threonine phosphatase [Janthinobacterium psychrotolerans]|uniref:Serine/threonine protein phosphatase PrpC n=1 Tax=Janthinobacterium psychrotolerans TaxID=1747903 RepID=A0A1A7C9C0_9BURK|nr:protein phosphatase 2C domain-containing protein [Janthinobacterium psychrotolerans]OBV41604.1 Serine/threonine protein phosphatase PrpC [Janthinobacterium psychrotolerans]
MLNDRISRWLRLSSAAKVSSSFQETAIVLSTDTGLARKENQDRVAMMRVSASVNSSPFVVVALADGMGGMSDGAECAVQTLSVFFNAIVRLRNYPPQEMLRAASLEANMAVFSLADGKGGATLSAIFISNNSPLISLNIGDSRIYGRSHSEIEPIIRLTVDDNLEEVVGGTGTELLQFSGMGRGLKPHIALIPDGINRLLITSDGVHFINKNVLNDILLNTKDVSDASKQLLTYVRWRGAPDNASLAIIDVKDVVLGLKYEASGIELADPSGMLEIAWIKQDASEPSPYAPSPSFTEPEREVKERATPPTEKKKGKKDKPVVSSRKKQIDDEAGHQFSIQIDTTPINEDPEIGIDK